MASAAVVLGLLPTMLSLAGSSTLEMGIFALRRPLLAFLLAAGSPAVSPIRTFEYRDPSVILQLRPEGLRTPSLSRARTTLVCGLEYLLAMAAVANLAIASYQLSTRTSCSSNLETTYLPALWAFLALAVHLGGTCAVLLRLRIVNTSPANATSSRSRVSRLFRQEVCLGRDQEEATLEYLKESYYFVVLSWCVSTGTVLHVMHGTLVFSSILFISTQDALKVAAQYVASTLVCRMILMFELSGMSGVIKAEDTGGQHVYVAAQGKQ